MNQSIAKSEIWRSNTGSFVRLMYGLRIFLSYIGIIRYIIFMCMYFSGMGVLERNYQRILNTYLNSDGGSSNLSSYINDYMAMNKMITVFIICFNLFVITGTVLWYHLGKSRVLATLYFIIDIIVCMLVIGTINNSNGVVILVLFLLLLFVTLTDFLIMRGMYHYHEMVAREKLKYEERIRRNAEKSKYPSEFQITKPKLNVTYSNSKDSSAKQEKKIKIDDYLADKTIEGKSVYQNTGNSDEIGKADDVKKKLEKSRTLMTNDFVSHDRESDSKYQMENRPLLSAIKEQKEEKSTEPEVLKEPEATIHPKEYEFDEQVTSDAENATAFEPEPAESMVKYDAPEHEKEDNTTEETSFKSAEAEEVEEIKTDDGLKVDTSLGYRRITFDDM